MRCTQTGSASIDLFVNPFNAILEEFKHGLIACTVQEQHEIPGSRGEANFVWKCRLCTVRHSPLARIVVSRGTMYSFSQGLLNTVPFETIYSVFYASLVKANKATRKPIPHPSLEALTPLKLTRRRRGRKSLNLTAVV